MPYALAVLAVLAAFLAAVLLSDAIRPNFSPLFFVAITFAAWWGGLGPGLLATLIAVVLLEYIFAFPSGAMWEPGSLVRTAMFLLAALLINSLHAARQRAETELARRAHLAEFTAAFGQLLATARGELPMLEGCARIVRESLPVEQVGLWTVDGEDGDSGEPEVLRRRVHLGPESAAPGQRRVVGESEREPDVVPLAVRPEESDWLARVIRRGRDENTVARIERGNGVRYALPLVADGQILGALDVWCREAALPEMAEAALLTAADRLAVAISARHAGEMLARQTETLQVALDQAGEASRMKNDFFASISHEIRTPMNGVLGMADLLRDTTLSGSQQEMVEAIRTSADSLLALLNDILDFSRGAAGKLSLDAVPFDLRQVVEQVADLMAPLADQRGLELLVRYHEQTPRRLIGDSGRVRQILVNLVSNAIKFTENGFVLLDVQVTQTAEEEALLIAVQDSGVGIPEDKLDYIFERFAQADSGSVRRPGGAGLGLAICRQLAEVMGGTIGVTSKPGAGSTFWFVLRLPHDPTAPPANPPDYSDLQVVGGVPDLVAREVLRDTLAGWRINPVLFGSTGETSQFLNTMPASPERETVIVLDQALLGPGDAGSELRSALRHCAGCSAILLTPAGDVGQRQPEIFEDVAWTVLPRPLTPTRLRRALRTARPKAAGGDEQRPPTPADDPAANAAPTKDAPLWVAGRKPRILVAEDNRINQWVTAAQLQRMGCEITVVENGAEAVAATMRETFDLILMDCQMPRMDGYEATRQILRQSGPATPPILAMTANASPQDRERCLQVGMSGCLVKPVREAQLRPILAELLSGATEPPVIDTPSLWARYGDDAEILRPAVEIYRREMPALLQTLQTAAAGKNWPEVHRRAHEIKGVALQYDANILAETAQQLMQATQAAGEETSVAESDAYTLVAAIQALARRVEPMLLQMLAEQSAREF